MSRKDRERQLLDVAEAVFGELGFADTTMEEIASRAGITKPVIYDHFGSKERLLIAVVGRARQDLIDDISAAFVAIPRGAPLEESFRAGVDAFFTFFENRRASFRAYQQEASVLAAAGSDIEEVRMDQVRLIMGWIERITPGMDLPPVILEGMAGIAVAANERIAALRLKHPEITKDMAVNMVMAVLWNGFESMSKGLTAR